MEDKRVDYNLPIEALGKRIEGVGVGLKRRVEREMAKQQAKEEIEMGEK